MAVSVLYQRMVSTDVKSVCYLMGEIHHIKYDDYCRNYDELTLGFFISFNLSSTTFILSSNLSIIVSL
jgi:hypothetical protein